MSSVPVTGPRGQRPDEWRGLVDGSSCPICLQGEPFDVVASLDASWATVPIEAPVPWYVCVVAKTHVVEPFELDGPERSRFWNDVLMVAEAVHVESDAIKTNYEIHGNSLPHLHCHVYPLTSSDPMPLSGRSISRQPGQVEKIAETIRSAREASGGGT